MSTQPMPPPAQLTPAVLADADARKALALQMLMAPQMAPAAPPPSAAPATAAAPVTRPANSAAVAANLFPGARDLTAAPSGPSESDTGGAAPQPAAPVGAAAKAAYLGGMPQPKPDPAQAAAGNLFAAPPIPTEDQYLAGDPAAHGKPDHWQPPPLWKRLLFGASAGLAGLRDPAMTGQLVDRYQQELGQRQAQAEQYNRQLPAMNQAADDAKYQRFLAGMGEKASLANVNSQISGRLAGQAAQNRMLEDEENRWTPIPQMGVETKPDGETRQIMVNGQPVSPPSTPERDKQRMLQLEQALHAGSISAPDRSELEQLQLGAKMTGARPEIIAQVGQPPVPAQFLKGMADPAFVTANKAWGAAYEKVANEEAEASGAARGAGYNETRPLAVIDAGGNLRFATAAEAEKLGYAPAGQGQAAMSRQAQIQDIRSGIGSVRQALNAKGLDAFTAGAVAQLKLAMGSDDHGVMGSELENVMASGLSPQQQDLLVALQQLGERVLSLRSVAGMGQGSETTRGAILRAIPSITSGNSQLALKQLDALENMVDNLAKGIPGVKGSPPAGGTPASATTTPQTHAFDARAWSAANPRGDVRQAIAAAKAQGYQVVNQ